MVLSIQNQGSTVQKAFVSKNSKSGWLPVCRVVKRKPTNMVTDGAPLSYMEAIYPYFFVCLLKRICQNNAFVQLTLEWSIFATYLIGQRLEYAKNLYWSNDLRLVY